MKNRAFLIKSALLGSIGVPIIFGLVNLRCAVDSSNSGQTMVNFCNVPVDQTGTITAHWLTTPIPIALHQGDFNSSEASAITSAADSWNSFFTFSLNVNTLTYGGNSSSPTQSQVPDPAINGSPCSQEILQGGQFNGNVVIYKVSNWKYASQAMAITTNCFVNATPYPTSYSAIMEINYQNFFTGGQQVPDLQSIVLHELGHLHGINHSCESTAKTGTPNCTDPSINPDYLKASMFPTFSFGTNGAGEQRRYLGINDQERVNCLYTGPNGPAPSGTPSPGI